MLPVRGLAIAYIDVMRGIPLLLVILLISGSLPFLDLPARCGCVCPDFFGKPDIFWYGVMSITLTYGAYYAEVYRAGLEARPLRPDGGGPLARDEPRASAMRSRDRPAGDPAR